LTAVKHQKELFVSFWGFIFLPSIFLQVFTSFFVQDTNSVLLKTYMFLVSLSLSFFSIQWVATFLFCFNHSSNNDYNRWSCLIDEFLHKERFWYILTWIFLFLSVMKVIYVTVA